MSHLPSPSGRRDKAKKVHTVVVTPENSPVLATQIAKAICGGQINCYSNFSSSTWWLPRKIDKSFVTILQQEK